MATIVDYPDGVATAGPTINRLIDQPIEYRVALHRNEDGGCDVNVQPCGWRRWVLEYEGLEAADVATLRAHLDLAKGRVNNFEFFHRRDSTTYADVRYVDFKVGRHSRKWANLVTVTLGKLI